jgi:hypothetical protein
LPRRNYRDDRDRFRRKSRRKNWNDDPERAKYVTYLEYRMAMLLRKHGIRFEYSKRFDTVDQYGNPNFREVDFWLEEPIDVYWCENPVQAIEVKGGKLDERCWHQKRELKNAGVNTFIAIPAYITFWEHHGFLKENGMYPKRPRFRD